MRHLLKGRSDGLDVQQSHYFQSLIGILHWICEFRHLDILVAVSTLSCSVFQLAMDISHIWLLKASSLIDDGI